MLALALELFPDWGLDGKVGTRPADAAVATGAE